MISFITQQILHLLWMIFKNKINSSSELCLSKDVVRKIMKEKWNLSFSRWRSRPNNVDLEKVKISRSLFCTKFSQMVNKKSLIINIDESSISRSTKIDYTWSKKGDAKEYKKFSIYWVCFINICHSIKRSLDCNDCKPPNKLRIVLRIY